MAMAEIPTSFLSKQIRCETCEVNVAFLSSSLQSKEKQMAYEHFHIVLDGHT